jgi:RimJ/RimL family protein N-acetyltransferase
MTEAVDAVGLWATNALPSIREITTSVAAANVRSARVLEKCGFRRVGSAFEIWAKDAAPIELHMYRREA